MKRTIKLLLTALTVSLLAPSLAVAQDDAPEIKLEQTQRDDSLGKTETSEDDNLGKPETPEKLDVTVTPGVVVDTTADDEGATKADEAASPEAKKAAKKSKKARKAKKSK